MIYQPESSTLPNAETNSLCCRWLIAKRSKKSILFITFHPFSKSSWITYYHCAHGGTFLVTTLPHQRLLFSPLHSWQDGCISYLLMLLLYYCVQKFIRIDLERGYLIICKCYTQGPIKTLSPILTRHLKYIHTKLFDCDIVTDYNVIFNQGICTDILQLLPLQHLLVSQQTAR